MSPLGVWDPDGGADLSLLGKTSGSIASKSTKDGTKTKKKKSKSKTSIDEKEKKKKKKTSTLSSSKSDLAFDGDASETKKLKKEKRRARSTSRSERSSKTASSKDVVVRQPRRVSSLVVTPSSRDTPRTTFLSTLKSASKMESVIEEDPTSLDPAIGIRMPISEVSSPKRKLQDNLAVMDKPSSVSSKLCEADDPFWKLALSPERPLLKPRPLNSSIPSFQLPHDDTYVAAEEKKKKSSSRGRSRSTTGSKTKSKKSSSTSLIEGGEESSSKIRASSTSRRGHSTSKSKSSSSSTKAQSVASMIGKEEQDAKMVSADRRTRSTSRSNRTSQRTDRSGSRGASLRKERSSSSNTTTTSASTSTAAEDVTAIILGDQVESENPSMVPKSPAVSKSKRRMLKGDSARILLSPSKASKYNDSIRSMPKFTIRAPDEDSAAQGNKESSGETSGLIKGTESSRRSRSIRTHRTSSRATSRSRSRDPSKTRTRRSSSRSRSRDASARSSSRTRSSSTSARDLTKSSSRRSMSSSRRSLKSEGQDANLEPPATPQRRGTRSGRSKSPGTLRSTSQSRRTRSSSRSRAKDVDNGGIGAALLDVASDGTITLTISDGSNEALMHMKAAGAPFPEVTAHSITSMGSLPAKDEVQSEKKESQRGRSSSRSKKKSGSSRRLAPSETYTETPNHSKSDVGDADFDALQTPKKKNAPNVIQPADFHDSVVSFDSVPDWSGDKDSQARSPEKQQQEQSTTPHIISPRKMLRKPLSIPTIQEEPGKESDDEEKDESIMSQPNVTIASPHPPPRLRKIQSLQPRGTPAVEVLAAAPLTPDRNKKSSRKKKILSSFSKPLSFRKKNKAT